MGASTRHAAGGSSGDGGSRGGPTTESRNAADLIVVGLGVVLLGFGIYRVLLILPLLTARAEALLIAVAFAVEAGAAVLAGIALLARDPLALAALVVLGVAIAATSLLEAFALGIIPALHALAVCIAVAVVLLLFLPLLRPILRS